MVNRHPYPRTESALRETAVRFSAGLLSAEELPDALESIAANLRVFLEAERVILGEPNGYDAALTDAIKKKGAR